MNSRTGLTSSGLLTASAPIAKLAGQLFAAQINGAAGATLTIYDNASAASGLVLCQLVIPSDGTMQEIAFNHGVVANQGIYASVTGTANVIVHYILGA